MSQSGAYAVVKTSGQQVRVAKGDKITVNRVAGDVGTTITLSDVVALSSGDGSAVTVGTPTVKGAQVTATIVAHKRGPKVLIFKKRRRKGYTKKQGHRQELTTLLIDGISN